MLEKVLYSIKATAQGGREGRASSDDGALDLKLTTPKALDGNGLPGTNPEQLFAAGNSACFIGAMRFVANQGGPKVPDAVIGTSQVGIVPLAAGGFGIRVDMQVSLAVMPHNQAEALVEEAHRVCPYSKATRGNVDVTLAVV